MKSPLQLRPGSTETTTGEVLLPLHIDTEALRAQIMPLLIRQIEEYQKKLEEQAINILVQYNGPECKFVELENDAGHGLGIGQHIQDPDYPDMTRIRITAANIINMENMS